MQADSSNPRKFKLLFITDTYAGGRAGSERYLYKLSTSLDPSIFEITIIQLTTKTDIPYKEGRLEEFSNIYVKCIPVRRVYGLDGLRAYFKIRKIIMDDEYDVIQSLHEKADLINAFLPKARGTVYKVSSRRDMGFKKSRFLRSLFRLINSRFDAIVAPSQAILNNLQDEESVNKNNLCLIRNGVDIKSFVILSEKEKEELRSSLSIEGNKKIVGCVGNLKKIKGHQYLLDAFSKLLKHYPDSVLVLVGDGEERESIEQHIRKNGIESKVRLLGARDDVISLLQVFDIVVSSSLSEGLSNALIEAAASSLPIVATDVGGNPEIVIKGENGLLVPAKDSMAMYQALLKLFEDRQRATRMGQQGRALVERQYSSQSVISLYQDLFKRSGAVRRSA